MDLRQLRYFIAVAEEGHITRDAYRLGIQQPPLSRLIRAIEQDLDVRLFIRKPRGVELTEAGLAFYREATQVLASVENAVETTRSTARGERGRICVGVTPTGPFVPFVPQVMHAFRRAFPNVNFTLEERLSSELLDLVRTRRSTSPSCGHPVPMNWLAPPCWTIRWLLRCPRSTRSLGLGTLQFR
jgi:DNA-binding transcriptional LysR family regulator